MESDELSLARREVERKEVERQDDDAAHAACEYICLFWQAQFLFMFCGASTWAY